MSVEKRIRLGAVVIRTKHQQRAKKETIDIAITKKARNTKMVLAHQEWKIKRVQPWRFDDEEVGDLVLVEGGEHVQVLRGEVSLMMMMLLVTKR